MEKKSFQDLFKKEMKALGFRSRGKYCYKFLSDDYLVGVWLDHCPYAKAYYIEYGVIYEPDEKRLPFAGLCDWSSRFIFTVNPNDDLAYFPIENSNYKINRSILVDWFEYEVRTSAEFEKQFAVNCQKKLIPLYDRAYVLNEYRANNTLFRMVPLETAYKIGRLVGLDEVSVNQIRIGR